LSHDAKFSLRHCKCGGFSEYSGHPIRFTVMKIKYLLPTVAAVFALASCGGPVGPDTQRGAATGGLLGAAVGGVIGHQSGRALEGAAIGGATGAAAGALHGNARDQERGW